MTTNTDGAMPELPDMPSNIGHVMRRIRACESEVPAQLVLEHALREYARAAIEQAAGAVPEGRSDKDFAIEHAEYMAKAAECFMDAVNAEDVAVDALAYADEATNPERLGENFDQAQAYRGEMTVALRGDIYEFRKRRDRVASPAPPKQQTCVSQNAKSEPQTILTRTDDPQKPDSVHLGGGEVGGVPQWQPIETAPKDGTDILLANDKAVSPAGWVSDVEHGAEWEGQIGMAGWWTLNGDARPPTHWMPLPPPPAPRPESTTGQINKPATAAQDGNHG